MNVSATRRGDPRRAGLVALAFALALALAPASLAAQAVAVPSAGVTTIRFAALPLIDMVPLYVAEKEGLFAANRVKVEFIPVGAAPERDQLLASGKADGAVNEIHAVIAFNREKVQMKSVRWALRPAPGFPHFFILASKNSGISGASGLRGVEIGVSQATIIEYVTERLLQAAGLKAGEIRTLNVPRMPDRMALLSSGQIKAATMPDPLATLAKSQGAVVALDDSAHPEFGSSVISFRSDFIAANPAALRGFLAAVEKATVLVNADPAKYAGILAERQLVPPAISGIFRMPPFPLAGVPAKAEFDNALAWLREKGLIAPAAIQTGSTSAGTGPSWANSVEGSYLPR